jgi:sec-independent protein translocase protein TatB
MEVLGIGPFEIALVALIAFIVLGPDRIPGVMRQLGTWVRQLRELTNNITRDYGTDIQQLTGEITALQEEFRSIQRELGQVATGFMTTTLSADANQTIAPKNPTPVEPAAESTPPARSNTVAPTDTIEPETAEISRSNSQSLTDDIKRVSTSAPPLASTETDSSDAYTI